MPGASASASTAAGGSHVETANRVRSTVTIVRFFSEHLKATPGS